MEKEMRVDERGGVERPDVRLDRPKKRCIWAKVYRATRRKYTERPAVCTQREGGDPLFPP